MQLAPRSMRTPIFPCMRTLGEDGGAPETRLEGTVLTIGHLFLKEK